MRYDACVPETPHIDERPYDPAVPYVSVPEAAQSLGVSEQAIRNAISDGRLPCVHLFARYMLAPADVEAYRERTRPGGEKPRGRPRKKA